MQKKKDDQSKKPDSYSTSINNTEGPCARANEIVNNRSEEQERRHGPFSDGMIKASVIATELCGKQLSAVDMYKILMALKLSRISHSIELDSMTDLCGYTEGLWNFMNDKD